MKNKVSIRLDWVTVPEAVEITGLSAKTLYRMAGRGGLRSKRELRNGSWITVYERAEIEKVQGQDTRTGQDRTLRTSGPSQPPKEIAAPPKVELPSLPAHTTLFLTLDQAVVYTGLPKAHLERLHLEGILTPVNAGTARHATWRFRRTDLEQL